MFCWRHRKHRQVLWIKEENREILHRDGDAMAAWSQLCHRGVHLQVAAKNLYHIKEVYLRMAGVPLPMLARSCWIVEEANLQMALRTAMQSHSPLDEAHF